MIGPGWVDDRLTEETRRRLAEALEADTPGLAALPERLRPAEVKPTIMTAEHVARVFDIPLEFVTGDRANRAAKRTPWLRLFKGGRA